jgi:hypothetical protein
MGGSDLQSAKEILNGMGIVARRERGQGQIFNRELYIPASLHNAPWNRPRDFDWTHESDAKHHGRRLIYRRINFVVVGFRDVRRGNSCGVDDARQQEQNECPENATH